MKLLRPLDDLLNGITMYRLLVYGLSILAAVSVFFAAAHRLSLSPLAMMAALAILMAVCYAINKSLAVLWEAGTNSESWLITALILFFILPPPANAREYFMVALAAIIAMASKYLIAWHHKQIFNPAALAAVIVGLLSVLPATWWVGSPILLPFTLLLGLLIVRKIRRWPMVVTFITVALVVFEAVGQAHGHSLWNNYTTLFASWPLIFLGTIMLTEPSTQPPHTREQVIYGGLVGAIFTSQLHIGSIASTPEMALIIGNLYAFTISPKYRLKLKLVNRVKLSNVTSDFSFAPDRPIKFQPGQYLEWTLPHGHADSRGNRRSFTIASSPTEPQLHIGVKFYDPSSSFKHALSTLQPGQSIMAGQLTGSFVMPRDTNQKLAFVAGGIGITPFRSMVKYLIDKGEKRDIVLFYAVADPGELSYLDVLTAGSSVGVKMIQICDKPVPGWTGQTGFITPEMIKAQLPDFKDRRFYLSGPNAMVTNYRRMLRQLGVRKIVTDYFPGY